MSDIQCARFEQFKPVLTAQQVLTIQRVKRALENMARLGAEVTQALVDHGISASPLIAHHDAGRLYHELDALLQIHVDSLGGGEVRP